MGDSSVFIHGEGISPCGYCKVDNIRVGQSVSFGITSEKMNVDDYERLMLVGWRRSGTYFYKPIMHKTCCPAYTIRLEASRFRYSKSQRQILRRFQKYLQTGSIHDNTSNVEVTSMNSELRIELVKPTFTREKYELYKKYQIIVHHDNPEEISETGYKRFLVESPLIDNIDKSINEASMMSSITERQQRTMSSSSGNIASSSANTVIAITTVTVTKNDNNGDGVGSEREIFELVGYGTFHQEYKINDKLIAVGVVDILPSGLSSVYLYYDPDMNSLVLGKYTALKEIEYCQQHNLKYYYMGFYIHDCVKMNYKGEYKPSELLCPTTLQWFDLNFCKRYLDTNKFTPLEARLAEERSAIPISDNLVQALKVYMPRFSPTPIHFHKDIRLLLRKDMRTPVITKHLTTQGQEIVKNILEEFVHQCGYDILQKLVILLYSPYSED